MARFIRRRAILLQDLYRPTQILKDTYLKRTVTEENMNWKEIFKRKKEIE